MSKRRITVIQTNKRGNIKIPDDQIGKVLDVNTTWVIRQDLVVSFTSGL